MSKLLVAAAVAAVALGSVVATSDANARAPHHGYVQGYYYVPGYYGYVPGYYGPRRFYESPMFAPDAPAPRNYNNPGIPDFQDGSRG
jgi:hypothetical protein